MRFEQAPFDHPELPHQGRPRGRRPRGGLRRARATASARHRDPRPRPEPPAAGHPGLHRPPAGLDHRWRSRVESSTDARASPFICDSRRPTRARALLGSDRRRPSRQSEVAFTPATWRVHAVRRSCALPAPIRARSRSCTVNAPRRLSRVREEPRRAHLTIDSPPAPARASAVSRRLEPRPGPSPVPAALPIESRRHRRQPARHAAPPLLRSRIPGRTAGLAARHRFPGHVVPARSSRAASTSSASTTRSDPWSGGTMRSAARSSPSRRNLILQLPANWLTRQQLFDQRAALRAARGASAGLATLDGPRQSRRAPADGRHECGRDRGTATAPPSGNVIAGEVFISEGHGGR